MFFILFFALSACSVSYKISGGGSSQPSLNEPNVTMNRTSFYSGESVLLSSILSDTNYTFSNPDGHYDSGTQSLSFSKNLTTRSTSFVARDSAGASKSFNLTILGLDESFEIVTPQTYGSQNNVTGSTRLATGEMFLSAIVEDSAGGWEWAVIYKSSDNGTSWDMVDYYSPYNNGESHALSVTSIGQNIIACGYQWDGDNYDAIHWFIRRSSNNGATWQTTFFDNTPNADSRCQSITVSTATGFVYAAGYDSNGPGNGQRWVVRESQNNGLTWNIIYTFDASGFPNSYPLHIKVSPNNTIWLMVSDSSSDVRLYKGTFSLGSWTFNIFGPSLGTRATSQYQLFGDLEIVDDNNAFLSSNFSPGFWTIQRTIDGGASWNSVFSSADSTAGEIKVLNNGDVAAVGMYTFLAGFLDWDYTIRVAKSTDGGATFSSNDIYTSDDNEWAGVMMEDQNNHAHMINPSRKFARHYVSTNSATTWSALDYLTYRERFNNYVSDVLVTDAGTYLAVGSLGSIGPQDNSNPWYVGRSTDQGNTWTDTDLIVFPGESWFTVRLVKDKTGNIYAQGRGPLGVRIRKSNDDGVSWTTVDTYSHPLYNSSVEKITVDENDDIFYATRHYNSIDAKYYVELRKGTNNGTSWSNISTFPLNPTHSNFQIHELTVDKTGALWLAGTENNAVSQNETVIFKSTDSAATWNEVYRAPVATGGNFNQLVFDSSGTIYGLYKYNRVSKSLDGGLTWIQILDATASPFAMVLSGTDKLFVNGNVDQLLKKSDINDTWVTINDQASIINPAGRNYIQNQDVDAVVSLGDHLGIITSFGENSVGVVNVVKRLYIGP